MTKLQIVSTRRHDGVSSFGRRLFACSWILLLAISIWDLSPKAAAAHPPTCFDQCEQKLTQCMQQAHGNPGAESQCQDSYDACIQWCLLFP